MVADVDIVDVNVHLHIMVLRVSIVSKAYQTTEIYKLK